MDPSKEQKQTPKVISEEEPSWWDKFKATKQRQYDAARKRRIKRDAIRHQGKDYRYGR